jgi:hypothetical protein
MLDNFNDDTDTTVTKDYSEEDDCDDWSHSTIDSKENLSTKTTVKSKNWFEASASLSIQHKRVLTSGDEFKFVYSTLDCQCCFSGTTMVTIGDINYMDACRITTRWYETDFISSFSAMCAHMAHLANTQLILCHNPKALITIEECREINNNVFKIISVLHAESHFVYLEIDLIEHILYICNGLKYQLKLWIDHCTNILKRCKFIPLDFPINKWEFIESKQEYALSYKNIRWRLISSEPIVTQTNHYNFGPIRCLQIMQTFGRLPPMIKQWDKLLHNHSGVLLYPTSKKMYKI